MKKIILILIVTLSLSIVSLSTSKAQNVGIGTTTPNANALLHVDLGTSITKGVLVTGAPYDFNPSSTVPNLGAGPRMMFYPGKSAFRAGYVTADQWDDVSVGYYSTALGYNVKATANYTTALGNGTAAIGTYSTALGDNSSATGISSTALGGNTLASGSRATAMGFNTYASASYSTAMGYQSNATGSTSTAMGYQTIASGIASTAMGQNVTASGNNSTAIGYRVSTNNQTGAFIIGDSDPNNEGVAAPGIPDLFVARFWNGYYLLTSGYTNRIGVQIGHNGNAWVSICDANLKENFEPLNGEDVLQKISKINFTSWNYKQQDPKIYRHYGITAQDFYNAFGKDKFGTIGNDTTVNPIDMIGINMAAIQALEKRSTELNADNKKLKMKNDELEVKMVVLNERLLKLEKLLLK